MNTNLVVQSSPAAGTTNAISRATDIRALKPPIEIPNYWFWVWVAVGVLAVVALCIVALLYWRKKAQQPPIIPIVPPHVRARQKLEEALALISQPKPFCVLVSDTVRTYLEERFRFHAPEWTTEEFLYELQASDLLTPDQKTSLGEFLSVCDMVKFARYEPGDTELHALHQSAVRLIDETEPQPIVPEIAQTATA